MKVLKQGVLETSICTCERCFAELEYTLNDIVGTGKLTAVFDSDWVDKPVIQDSWPKYVKAILKKYGDNYVAYGHFAKRDGYVECPCCGNKIYLEQFPVQTSVYPGNALSEDGEVIKSEVIQIPHTPVEVLISHYNEFTKNNKIKI